MKKIIVEEYAKILEKLLLIFHEALPQCNNISKCYKNRNKINPKKHLNYFYKRISKVQEQILKKDTQLFEKPIFLVPEINISELWTTINDFKFMKKYGYIFNLYYYTLEKEKVR